MSEYKFKVGDRVRIKDWRGWGLEDDSEYLVTNTRLGLNNAFCHYIFTDGGYHYWDEKSLELASEENTDPKETKDEKTKDKSSDNADNIDIKKYHNEYLDVKFILINNTKLLCITTYGLVSYFENENIEEFGIDNAMAIAYWNNMFDKNIVEDENKNNEEEK